MPIKQIPRPGIKKQELLARKQKILSNLKYYEKRIPEETLANADAASVVYDESSDSESDLLPCQINSGPTISELREKEEMLVVGLNATFELACLEILQSEVHVMTEDPVIKGEAPVLKPGLWKEVTAECRIGTVHFSISFHVHQAEGHFGAKSYRNLQVLPVKKSHEVELSKSVLPVVKCPSDAIEVFRSYSVAHRSRRSTLGRLADKYAGSLFMEPMADGGFKLKCANLLELSWVLENCKSPLAPFHHKMVFDLEYMDESYIKVIRQAHKQLSDPTIDTDERTLLLAQILNTCLEAEGAIQESTESEVESVKKVDKRRITLETDETVPKKIRNHKNDDDNEENIMQDNDIELNSDANDENNKKDDNQIMAPPKSLPKKMKPKGKENMDQNKRTAKRSTVVESNSSAKKAKLDKMNANTKTVRDDELNVLSNDKEDKETNDKITKTQCSTEKEATKASDKVKPAKSKSKETIDISKAANNHNVNNEIHKKSNKKVQEIAKKQANREIGSENNADDEITKASDKGKLPKSKSKEMIEPVKTADNQNDNNEIKNKNNTKKVQEMTKKQISKGIELQKDAVKEISKATDKVKVVTSKTKETTEVTESGESQNVKAKEMLKKDGGKKVQEKTEKQINKDSVIQNVEKEKKISNTKNINKAVSTENAAQSKHNNAKSKQIVKKVASSKNLNANENSSRNDPKCTEVKEKNSLESDVHGSNVKNQQANINAKPKVDKIVSKGKTQIANKGITNKKDTENAKVTKDVINEKGVSNNQNATKDAAEKQKDSINPFDRRKIISSTPKCAITSENRRNSGKKIEAKIINVASKNREHFANIATKNVLSKTRNDKPKLSLGKSTKMVINNLSHKNLSSKNKAPKIIAGNIKNARPTKVGKDFKTGDSSKDSNGSKISKIPMKLGIPDKFRRNSLRISTRRLQSTFKGASDSSDKKKFNQITNIPRLMKNTK